MIISARISGAALCFALLSSLPQRNEIMRTEYFFLSVFCTPFTIFISFPKFACMRSFALPAVLLVVSPRNNTQRYFS